MKKSGSYCFCIAFMIILYTSISIPVFAETGGPHNYNLKNGVQVILIPNHSVPMFSSTVIVRTGVIHETRNLNGVSHMLEHMLFNGTDNRTQQELYDDVDLLGAYNNAFTRHEFSTYMFVVPREHVKDSLELQSDMVFHSTITTANLEKEKGIVTEEISKNNQNPMTTVNQFFREILFPGSPLGYPVIGTKKSVNNFTREDVKTYYNRYYTPSNMILICTGDFNIPQLKPIIEKTFGVIPTSPSPSIPVAKINWPSDPVIYQKKIESQTTYLVLGFPAPPSNSPEFFPFQVLTRILDSGYKNSLKELLSSEAGAPVVYYVSVTYNFHPHHPYFEVFMMAPGKTNVTDIANRVIKAFSKLSHDGITRDLVSRTILKMRTEEYSLQEKMYMYGVMKAPLISSVSTDYFLNYSDHLNMITLDKVKTVARKYLNTSVFKGVALGPSMTDNVKIKPGLEVEKPISKNKPEKSKRLLRKTLDNGLQIVLEKNPESYMLAIHVLAKNRSVMEPKGKTGITDFLHRFLENGTSLTMDRSRIQEELDRIGANLTVTDNPFIPFDDYYFTGEYSYIRLETTSVFAREALVLLSRILAGNQFDKQSIQEIKNEMVNILQTRKNRSSVIAWQLFLNNLLPGHPLSRPPRGTLETVKSINETDLEKFHRIYFAPWNLVLSMTGNLPIETMESYILQTFGKMKSGENLVGKKIPFPPTVSTTKTFKKPVGKSQSTLVMGNLVTIEASDLPALQAMTSMLSRRLAFQLREKQGLAYSIGARLHIASGINPCWGWIAVSIGTRPENLTKARKGIIKIIKKLRKKPPNEMELKKVVNGYVGKMLRRFLPSINRAYLLGRDEYFGWPPYADMEFIKKMKKLVPNDIRKSARNYLYPKKMVVAIAE